MAADRDEIEELKSRLAEAERQLGLIRTGLKAGVAVVLFLLACALIPPLAAIAGLTLFGAIVLATLFAYMYGVAWTAERLTSGVESSSSSERNTAEPP